MTFMLKIVRYNDIFATTCGIFLNLFLIYLVFTVNKSSMKQISRTLLQNSVLDFLLAFVILLAEPQLVVVQGIYYNIIGSPLRILGYEFAGIIIPAFGATIVLSILAMPVPFYIRYLVLCKNTPITAKHLIQVYVPIFGYSMLLFFAAVWCYPPIPEAYTNYKQALMTPFWLDEYGKDIVFAATPSSDIRLIIVFVMILASSVIGYGCVIFFGLKITKKLRESRTQMSERTLMLNKQLQRTLIIQTIGPLLTGNLPVCVLVTMSLFTLENNYVSLGSCFLLAWMSVINPLAAMCIIGPYRQRIKQILHIKNARVSTTSGNYNIESKNGSKVGATNISHIDLSKTYRATTTEPQEDENEEHLYV